MGDVVLLAVVVAAFAMGLSLATNVPPEVVDAPPRIRNEFLDPFSTVMATYGAVLSAIYGSFRYTVDRRNGVVAQRLTIQSRLASLLTRLPATAVGGAIVSLAAVAGGHVALAVVVGGIRIDWVSTAATAAVGAIAGLWGLGVGLLVQQHLTALFLSAITLGGAMIVGIFWAAGAAWLPLPAMLSASGFDIQEIGFQSSPMPKSPFAAAALVAWLATMLAAGALSFLRRDVKQ